MNILRYVRQTFRGARRPAGAYPPLLRASPPPDAAATPQDLNHFASTIANFDSYRAHTPNLTWDGYLADLREGLRSLDEQIADLAHQLEIEHERGRAVP